MAQAHITHQYQQFRKMSRAEWNAFDLEPWQQLKVVAGDPLAFRAYILRREGWQTLVNMIRGDHNLPNAF